MPVSDKCDLSGSSARPIRYGFGITEEEHDYDEVTREDDTDSAGGVEQMVDISALAETSDNLIDLDTGAGSMDCLDNGHDEDTFNDILDDNEDEDDDVYGHVDAFDEFENCTFSDHFGNDLMAGKSQLYQEDEKKASSNSSSVVMLPHLNSEDRLNNNSSLDALFTESMLMKKSLQCEQVNNSQVFDTGDTVDTTSEGVYNFRTFIRLLTVGQCAQTGHYRLLTQLAVFNGHL